MSESSPSPRGSVDFYYEVPIDDAKPLLFSYLENQGINVPSEYRDTYCTKLIHLTARQFQELLSDVYQELVRRHNFVPRKSSIFSSSLLSEMTPMRQQCRQALTNIQEPRLSDMVADIIFEMRRRENARKRLALLPLHGLDNDVSDRLARLEPVESLGKDVYDSPTHTNFSSMPLLQFNSSEGFNPHSTLCLNGQITGISEHPVAAGGYADIWKGTRQGQPVAIKVMRSFESTGKRILREKLLKRLWREFLSWSSLSHPNILPCLGFSYDFSQGRDVPSLISPWMSHGTVLSYLDDCPDITSRLKLIGHIGEGLCYLHSAKPAIVHGDLRATNVLVSDNGVPCLTDFGLAKILSETHGMTTTSETAGSLRWQSPELLRGDSTVSPSSDVWAFGMTALEILTGQRPYWDIKMDSAAFGQITNGILPSAPDGCFIITYAIWEILYKCWDTDIAARAPISEIVLDLMVL